MHQRFVIFAGKERIGSGNACRLLTAIVNEFEFHDAPYFLPDFVPLFAPDLASALTAGATRALAVFTLGRTTTSPPFEPGIAPLISSNPRASSTRSTSRFCVVRCTAPRCPDMRLPGNTRPGS